MQVPTHSSLRLVLLDCINRTENLVQSIRHDHLGGTAHVDGDNVRLSGRWRLKSLKLAVDHVGAHVMILARKDSLEEDLLGRIEVDEVKVEIRGEVGSHSNDITVLALQRRARQDHTVVTLVKSLN